MQPWMTFLNASLLAGTAAFAIPLVIHLLNRARFKALDWGAMLFLEDALRANSRRIEWQKWWLLLLRCAIPICLALCMARPLLQSSSVLARFPGGSPIATCLFIDNSLSMDAKIERPSQPSISAFELAQTHAIGLIQSSTRNSRWAMDGIGSRSSGLIDFHSRDVERQTAVLQAMTFGVGSSDILAALDRALMGFSKSTESRRRIIVCSDFQKSMCDTIEPSQVVALRQRLESLPNPPSIFFAPIRNGESQRERPGNLTVRVDKVTPSVVGIGQPWEVRLIIRNFGSKTATGCKLILEIDDTAISSKSLNVPENAETQLVMAMSFNEVGAHRVEAKLEVNDATPIDNRTSWSVLALNEIPVLIVDSTLKDQKSIPDSEFLKAALAPYAGATEQHANLFRVSQISPEELSGEKLSEHKVIILANVSKLNESIVRPLSEHVRSGGILVVFAGDRIDPDWYNKRLGIIDRNADNTAPSIGQRCLPYLFDSQPQRIASNEDGMKLRRENFQHSAVHFLNDTRVGSLSNLEVQGWYRMLPNSGSDDDNKARALLSLVNGDIFLAERTFGDGTILQCATTGNDDWTNWPLRPIFLPMLQQLLLNSTAPVRWRMNVETGQPLSAPSPRLMGWITNGISGSRLSKQGQEIQDESRMEDIDWRLPDGTEVSANSIVSELPGSYSIEGIGETPLYLSAQAPLGESNLEAESEDGLRSLADRLGASIIASPDEVGKLESRGGSELWRWFLIGLLVLLFGELFIQRRLSGVAA